MCDFNWWDFRLGTDVPVCLIFMIVGKVDDHPIQPAAKAAYVYGMPKWK
jgi:hypothetical protein